jgi:hypothetical protein
MQQFFFARKLRYIESTADREDYKEIRWGPFLNDEA